MSENLPAFTLLVVIKVGGVVVKIGEVVVRPTTTDQCGQNTAFYISRWKIPA